MNKNTLLFFSLFFASVVRIVWKLYTNFTYEDAFITFRFAQNLSNGLGFTYNTNEHIYGTTTPLFTLIMAGWISFFPNYIILGASIFGLLAGLASIALAWKVLDELHIGAAQGLLAIGTLILSDKFWIYDMGGMEMPLVICAMMASYLMLVRNKQIWAGVFAGILLWLRIDGLFWFGILIPATWYITQKLPYKFITAALLVYLPWLVFATLYFGSPIPYTISAKWVAYYLSGRQPFLTQAQTMLSWLTPFSLSAFSPYVIKWIAVITLIFSFIGALTYRRYKWLMVLPVFCLEESIRLVVFGETYEPRYFMPFFGALMILFGLGVYTVWAYLSRRFNLKSLIGITTVSIYICLSLWFSLQKAQIYKEIQYFVNDSSRKQVGIWLNNNTPISSTVFLEPLGYAGFYANRHMIDEVGLVSPQVVALKKEGNSTFTLITSIDPDYAVLHCDDALRASDAFLTQYTKMVEFNPLDFDPGAPMNYAPDNSSELVAYNMAKSRAACYQVWERIQY